MKEIRVTTTWQTTQTCEVSDDYVFTGGLDDEWADQVDAHTAELIDWEVDS